MTFPFLLSPLHNPTPSDHRITPSLSDTLRTLRVLLSVVVVLWFGVQGCRLNRARERPGPEESHLPHRLPATGEKEYAPSPSPHTTSRTYVPSPSLPPLPPSPLPSPSPSPLPLTDSSYLDRIRSSPRRRMETTSVRCVSPATLMKGRTLRTRLPRPTVPTLLRGRHVTPRRRGREGGRGCFRSLQRDLRRWGASERRGG